MSLYIPSRKAAKHPISQGRPEENEVCWRDHGDGMICVRKEGHGKPIHCKFCGGLGYEVGGGQPCPKCYGSGKVESKRQPG